MCACGQGVRDHSRKQRLAFDRAIDDPAAPLWQLAGAALDILDLGNLRDLGALAGILDQLAIEIGRILRCFGVHRLRHADCTARHERYACRGRG
jgi:hypothetical protein